MDWKARNKKDKFLKERDEKGLVSRAYFKIKEINEKFSILKKNDFVLDLGAAPGGWAQYCLLYTNNITAIDLLPLKINIENIIFIQEDINNYNNFSEYDLIISDMAPNTSGNFFLDSYKSYELCLLALNIAIKYLKNKKNFICKLFDGENTEIFIKECKNNFSLVKIFKPESSRKESKEIFIICLNKKDKIINI